MSIARRQPWCIGVIGGLVTALLALFLLAQTASAAPGSGSGIQTTCYGGSVSISVFVPLAPRQNWSSHYITSSRCNDINLRIDSGGDAKFAVCWARFGTCQDHWTLVPQDGIYHVVATNVKDGTEFYFATTATNFAGTRKGRTAY